MWGGISLWFWFVFPWWLGMLRIFSCVCWPSACLLEKCLFRSSVHFLIRLLIFFMLSCMSFLYILDVNPYWMCHLQYFLLLSGLPFCLLVVSFTVWKLCNLWLCLLFYSKFRYFCTLFSITSPMSYISVLLIKSSCWIYYFIF